MQLRLVTHVSQSVSFYDEAPAERRRRRRRRLRGANDDSRSRNGTATTSRGVTTSPRTPSPRGTVSIRRHQAARTQPSGCDQAYPSAPSRASNRRRYARVLPNRAAAMAVSYTSAVKAEPFVLSTRIVPISGPYIYIHAATRHANKACSISLALARHYHTRLYMTFVAHTACPRRPPTGYIVRIDQENAMRLAYYGAASVKNHARLYIGYTVRLYRTCSVVSGM